METPEKIRYAAQRLKQGFRVNRITVRDFLQHFEAERRGAVKVQAIRTILDSLDLETHPDFETAWIDELIWLRLKAGATVEENYDGSGKVRLPLQSGDGFDENLLAISQPSLEAQREKTSTALTSDAPDTPTTDQPSESLPLNDPTFRIGTLAAANQKLVTVRQDDPLSRATTLMLQHDFSQLPVMQGDRDVKGMITWKSIGSKRAFSSKQLSVGDCQEDVRIVDSNRALFDVISAVTEYGYVLVRNSSDRRITGVVTASDLTLQFQLLTQPFLFLREVELHVRQLLSKRVTTEDYQLLHTDQQQARKPTDVTELSFGEYVRLIQHPNISSKFGPEVNMSTLIELLEQVRVIRNDVMHFDPDPMTADELYVLRSAVRLMQSLKELLP